MQRHGIWRAIKFHDRQRVAHTVEVASKYAHLKNTFVSFGRRSERINKGRCSRTAYRRGPPSGPACLSGGLQHDLAHRATRLPNTCGRAAEPAADAACYTVSIQCCAAMTRYACRFSRHALPRTDPRPATLPEAKTLVRTRPVYHSSDVAFRGHVLRPCLALSSARSSMNAAARRACGPSGALCCATSIGSRTRRSPRPGDT